MDTDTLDLGGGEALAYRHVPPRDAGGVTFVPVNALTGDLGMWEATVGPALREAGHGTLLWNLRGQAGSPAAAGTRLDADLAAADTARLLAALAPARPVLVGLSIGGLFALHARLAGAPAEGIVLVNTLRRAGARVAWINDAVLRAARVGGLALVRDLFSPLLMNEEWLAASRAGFLRDEAYAPIDPASGEARLLDDSRGADWDVPYERVDVPVLVLSGLQDRVFFDAADVARLAARLPDARRVDLPDAGHMIPVERPERLAELLLEFAGELGGG